MNTKPILALDFPGEKEVFDFLKHFHEPLFVKIGMELYMQEGPDIVRKVKELGHDVFLDLKLHDIPNTVFSAMKGLAKLGVNLVNVHAAGGRPMMEAALEGLEAGTPVGKERPALIAVTQLTSTTEEQMQTEQRIALSLQESVLHYARLTKQAALQGVVCSVHEAKAIAEVCGEDFLRVTPGIRLAGGAAHDQKRIATPDGAKREGSSLIVVGRAVTGAQDPVAAYKIVSELWEA
ncbi:orotidine-5'-phosphate decarboxylase [Lysinibacillus sphaericus]|uniref:Orotidine 5'-phosphate decarboxylase n=3 Tax=Lysinibacillus TaxID=400634 RepID=PYRF_LYSSC|nr:MULTISPECIES: orotidine-5'-phosphate decarboxylase [Lysinibacillus]B1HQC3.1 RecName: Full=Orotidine 5'-phosphate decarboxylase; AltName: Full=OMP decarboxylase; Short=OMPDCase; Short=OMPdecase [Lysinibacillus sphaericus C3-41]MBE5085057.1 orotidine-5'-phosphate decarboxylase [Bacillus thuringiensis]ACA39070.1 Orotidine 5'-phosphate decarboxylase [Lysinibacillus sphaericus C3-41]AMO34705.1 orotidine 5'-phosphate decarboxylase [Lysinibacillus sphaericus]AMR90179.1 orotidine 5'-phosphate decar